APAEAADPTLERGLKQSRDEYLADTVGLHRVNDCTGSLGYLGSVLGADEARDANGLLRGISPHCDQCDVHLAVWVRVKAELGLSQRRLPSEKAEVARLKGKVLEV